MSWWASAAAAAPVPAFAAVGAGLGDAVDDLFLLPQVQRVSTPRAASMLLVAGEVRPRDAQALRRVHDQMPHPRSTLWWSAQPVPEAGDRAHRAASAAHARDIARHLSELQRELLREPSRTEADWQPNQPPAPWRGVGKNGQGGDGMMGGTPYGRPMAMTAEDLRDGLQLDAFTLRLGPFATTLPAGLVLELTLQGDVVQQARIVAAPLPPGDAGTHGTTLRSAARLLDVLELPALAQRCRATAHGDLPARAALLRTLRRAGVFAAIPPGLGRSDADPSDVRERLHAWIAGAAAATTAPDQPDVGVLLRGLEWQEAMLVLASLDPDRLAPAHRAPVA